MLLQAELEEKEQRMKAMATDFEEQLKAARQAAEERMKKMENQGLVSTVKYGNGNVGNRWELRRILLRTSRTF